MKRPSIATCWCEASPTCATTSRTRGTSTWRWTFRTGRYLGRLYAVNPHAEPIGGVPCWPAVADLPQAPDLAGIAVPSASVLDTVDQCGRHGVQSVVVTTSGLQADGCAGLLAASRRHGMRLVG